MGKFLFFVAVAVAGFFWSGFVLSTLWGWFLVPLGVQAISLFHAAGISYLVSGFLGMRGIDYKTKDTRPQLEQYISWSLVVLMVPALVLFCGWLAKLGM